MPQICNMRSCFLIAFSTLLMGLVPACNSFAQENKVAQADDFSQRLENLEKLFEEERVKNKIPGLALAVVKDGEVVFAKGFGYSNLEEKTPVDAETLFAIGSSTKSFTSTLVAMLVDEGKMDWDDPVTKYLPDFKMDVDTGDEQITIRDLLCHRTGFTRMGLIWASGSKTRSEVIEQAMLAKPYADFQEEFLYNNVMYMTSGVCAGRATDSDWDTLISERIFKPLGMKDSTTSIVDAQKDSRLSLGYTWDKDREEFINLPMRNLDSIGPSGSINSNVNDMANWIRFQLANGKFDGKSLLSEEAQAETWTRQIGIAGDISYGFGWMLREWGGKKVVEHGGNIDGFGAQVTLLPEMNAGYVLLTNVTATPLQGGSVSLVFDTLFGEEAETVEDDPATIDMGELEGNYIANFGPFKEATMEVKEVDGNLTIDVPGQTTYELKQPDDEGKWYFALTDTIAVSFNRNGENDVISLTMYQGGATPEFVREEFEPKPDLPLAEITPLLGEYRDEEADATVKVSLWKGRLIVDTGAGGVFAFAPPEEGEDLWGMRAAPGMLQIRFAKNDEGKVESMTRIQRGEETEMKRLASEESDELPSVDEVLAKMRGPLLKLRSEVAGLVIKGQANFIHQGVQGSYDATVAMDGRFSIVQDFGEMAKILELYDGEIAVTDTTVGRREELIGKRFNMMKMQHPLWLAEDLKELYTSIEITGEQLINDEKTVAITFSGEEIYDRTIYVNPESGLVLREDTVLPSDIVGQIPIEVNYSDYREVHGVMLPFKFSSGNPFSGDVEVQIEEIVVMSEIFDAAFEMKELAR